MSWGIEDPFIKGNRLGIFLEDGTGKMYDCYKANVLSTEPNKQGFGMTFKLKDPIIVLRAKEDLT
jgi:hypothetical protein